MGTLAATLASPVTQAADHLDGSATGVKADKSTDINDVYAWVEGSKVNLIMTVFPTADNTSKFSNAAYYVFHAASRPAFANPAGTVPFDIICGFNNDTAQKISCWFGPGNANFVYGDASATTGLAPASGPLQGKVKIFAGLRRDHFFFNLDGFNAARAYVKANAGGLGAATNGCYAAMPAAAKTAVVSRLAQTSNQMTPPTDFFKDLRTLAIVMEVDSSLFTGGNIVSVWGATHAKTN